MGVKEVALSTCEFQNYARGGISSLGSFTIYLYLEEVWPWHCFGLLKGLFQNLHEHRKVQC